MTGKDIRIQRLFSRGENAVVIAIDHGYMDGPITGMENLVDTAARIDTSVDAILLSPGMLRHLGSAFNYKGAPLPVVRLNWSTVFCFEWQYKEAYAVRAFSAAEAVSLGAEAVLVSLTLNTGSEEQDAKNVELFSQMRQEAQILGIPVIGECFPNNHHLLGNEQMHDIVLRGSRILAELGADVIKTFHTCRFREVVDGCPVPILGLGGQKTPTMLASLQLAAREISEGAKGVVFGRNAIQVQDPLSYQKALCAVVKKNTDPLQALIDQGLKE